MGVGAQRHAPAALPQERFSTHCLERWVVADVGLDRAEDLAPTGVRSPDRPAHSEWPAKIVV